MTTLEEWVNRQAEGMDPTLDRAYLQRLQHLEAACLGVDDEGTARLVRKLVLRYRQTGYITPDQQKWAEDLCVWHGV